MGTHRETFPLLVLNLVIVLLFLAGLVHGSRALPQAERHNH